jgi:hypothetical protein
MEFAKRNHNLTVVLPIKNEVMSEMKNIDYIFVDGRMSECINATDVFSGKLLTWLLIIYYTRGADVGDNSNPCQLVPIMYLFLQTQEILMNIAEVKEWIATTSNFDVTYSRSISVEYVMRHNGAKHLRSPAKDLYWIQYFLLGVIAFLLFLLFSVAMHKVVSCLRKKQPKVKNPSIWNQFYSYVQLEIILLYRSVDSAK